MIFKRYILSRNYSYIFKKIVLITILFLALFFLFLTFKFFTNKLFNNYDESVVSSVVEKKDNKSIFNIRELNIEELKDRIILLNVYDIKDFSYIFSIDLANNLEKEFKNKIVIIDVITDNISIDKNTIINYIIKNNIERPIINVDNFDLNDDTIKNENRYFVLIDSKGIIKKVFLDKDINKKTISNAVNELITENPKVNTNALKLDLEKNNTPESFVKSLNHIKYIHRIDGTNNGPYFIVSDPKGRRIYLMTINGNIVNQVGSGRSGNDDLNGVKATFCYPFGLTVQDNRNLYVSDICNDSIRKVDLKTFDVTTLIKNDSFLQKPIDIEILNDNLIISTAGEDKLLSYNLKNNEVSKIECNDCNNFITKFVKFNNKVYFILVDNYGLYSIDKNNVVNKEIDFEKLNKENDIKITGNNNFHIDDTGFYYVDKFNNRILRVKDNKTKEYINNKDKDIFDLPSDIIDYIDKLYITNENNKKLVQLDKNTKNAKTINISFGYEYNKLKDIEDKFLNINNLEEIEVQDGNDIEVNINLNNDYSFEKMAPQSLILYKEDRENKNAILIKSFTKKEILENKTLKLPRLENNSIYYLKGNFYYCNYDKKTPCLINKYSKKILTNQDSSNKKIDINFIY